MTDHITDKAIWSATKAWYLTLNHGKAWDQLTEPERVAIRQEYLDYDQHRPRSAHALRADLRKARIDIEILQRKLDAANAKIARFEASRELAAALAEDAEGTCP
ncbi:hypothetical protein SEA_ALAKAZAM_50 [Microbacterium phage Alakazam]|nr:hypothetical protein SEA_ALAKAZAM_50 [Microbacterium phage Alakazam]